MSSTDVAATVVASYVIDALSFVKHAAPLDPKNTNKSVLAAIATETHVKNALAVLPSDPTVVDKTNYGPTIRLLNCVSYAYYKHIPGMGERPAIIFGSMANSPPRGDYLGLEFKPDYYAYIGTGSELNAIIGRVGLPRMMSCSESIQFSGHKREVDGDFADGQLNSDLCSSKRYRPDVPTVHSFSIENGILRLASLNACGMSVSPPAPWTELESWVAHVALLYETHSPHKDQLDTRKQCDKNLDYCPGQRDFHRWDVQVEDDRKVAVTPFYVARPPGKTTFACFEILDVPRDIEPNDPALLAEMGNQFSNGSVNGFWKMSWQPISPRPTELELLSELHQDGWVPGLVRPFELKRVEKRPSEADEAAKLVGKQKTDPAVHAKLKEEAERAIYHPGVKPDCVGENIGCVDEILHLGSIGQPLSQCKTAGDLLKVMYDLIEVHDHLCELGVLHRDVSWYNVMCNPKHLVKLHPLLKENKVLPRPCINQILGEGDPEPCVLLADLDHSIKLDGSATPQPGEKTGTPMFISVEVSRPKDLQYGAPRLDMLHRFLLAAGKDVGAFKLAFPDGDGTFMRDFERVMQLEDERAFTLTVEPVVPPAARHNRRHDAESIYWVFLWAFSRARPLQGQPLDDSELSMFEQFCNDMFNHSIGGKIGEAGRAAWILLDQRISTLFHPLLKSFQSLFVHMARYLAIPWFLYCGEIEKGPKGETIHNIMKPNHVHVAFRRLALGFMLDPGNSDAMRMVLDTQAPRFTSAPDRLMFTNPVPPTKRGITGASGTAPRPVTLRTGTRGSTSSLGKRKAASTVLPARKRKPSERATMGDDLGSEDYEVPGDEAIAEDPENDSHSPPGASATSSPEGKCADHLATTYVASQHLDAESAMALRLMFWKDRTLWFGAGVKPDADPHTQAAA